MLLLLIAPRSPACIAGKKYKGAPQGRSFVRTSVYCTMIMGYLLVVLCNLEFADASMAGKLINNVKISFIGCCCQNRGSAASTRSLTIPCQTTTLRNKRHPFPSSSMQLLVAQPRVGLGNTPCSPSEDFRRDTVILKLRPTLCTLLFLPKKDARRVHR